MKKIILDGYVGWEITAWDLQRQLPENKEEPVYIVVNSTGGDVFEGVYIYQLLQGRTNVTVEMGAIVASAATYIALAAQAIISNETTSVLIHNSSTMSWGDKNVMAKAMARLDGLDNVIAGIYENRLDKNREEILQMMNDETWFFEGKNIVAAGFADSIKPSKKSEATNSLNTGLIQNIVSQDRLKYSSIQPSTNSIMGQEEPMERIFNFIEKGKAKMPDEITNGGTAPSVLNEAPPEAPAKAKDVVVKAKTSEVENKVSAPVVDVEAIRNEAKTQERNRILGILNCSRMSVSENVTNAISEGKSDGEYAKSELMSIKNGFGKDEDDEELVGAIPAASTPANTAERSEGGKPEDKLTSEVNETYEYYNSQKNERKRVG